MTAPYWIHCNLCAALFSSKDIDLYVLSCSHLLCKTCMQNTERGTKCPLCKAAIKFIELKKLPSGHRQRFQNEIWRTIKNPLKDVNFQNTQKDNLTNKTLLYKVKSKKAAQVDAQMKSVLAKKKAELEKLTQQRKLMQTRLKEIYTRNMNKKTSQKYRPIDSISNSSGISSVSKSSFFGSSINANQNLKIPPLALYSTPSFFPTSDETTSIRSSSMFALPSLKKTQQQHRSALNERSQANRSPFFA